MSTTSTISNPPPQGESKTSRRKKNKGETGTPTSDAAVDRPAILGADAGLTAEGASELQFLRDLHKSVRNVKKKIAATQKVDAIVAENPDLSLDDLLATKKINADQKQQVERKPALQAQLRELEEELDRYKKVEESALRQHESEVATLKLEHAKELETLRDSVAQEAATAGTHQFGEKLLHLSKFLRAAAAKRQDGDEGAEESRAFEGALLLVYGGDMAAVQAMENIINGSDDLIPTVEGTKTTISYKRIRESFTDREETAPTEESGVEPLPQTNDSPAPSGLEQAQTDPTNIHVGLTEMTTPVAGHATINGGDAPAAPDVGMVDSGAANAAAESSWHNMSSSVTSGPDDWVQVHQIPRDPSETESGPQGTAAAATSTQSWAEDVPVDSNTLAMHPGPATNDGFHEVHHGRARGRAGYQGEHRGRGRGGYRGDRGDGSFRGRGGFRGDRSGGEGGPRGRGRGGFRGPRVARGENAA